VAKVLCGKATPGATPRNIEEYRTILTAAYPRLSSMHVLVPRFSLQVEPWQRWDVENPNWWRDHNRVKHSRHEDFRLATLHNALVAMAGLFCLVLYLYQEDLYAFRLHQRSNLFKLPLEPVTLVGGRFELPDFPPPAG
jgi:hypothetical protein